MDFRKSCAVLGVLLLIWVIYEAVESVPVGYVGFGYSSLTGTVDWTTTVQQGRQFVLPWTSFLTFPTFYISLNFSDSETISSRTSDGLDLELTVSFQYKLASGYYEDVYNDFKTDYREFFRLVARRSLRDSSSLFTAIYYVRNRTQAAAQLEEELETALRDSRGEISNFQLVNIQLPEVFETAMDDVISARQKILSVEEEQAAVNTTVQTAIIQAEYQATITIVEATAQATATVTEAQAEATTVSKIINATRDGLLEYKNNYNLTTTDLLKYHAVTIMEDHDTDKIVFDGNF